MNQAQKLANDYEELTCENDYGNQNMFNLLDDTDCTCEAIENGDLYRFKDGSSIKLRNAWYLVEQN